MNLELWTSKSEDQKVLNKASDGIKNEEQVATQQVNDGDQAKTMEAMEHSILDVLDVFITHQHRPNYKS